MNSETKVSIREELPGDEQQVRWVNEAAFGREDEADLVDQLRLEGASLLSLVAEWNGQIVGHVLFSRMTVETAQGSLPAVSLAPVAVLPEQQRHGIGSALIRHGIGALQARGERIVIVLGSATYYPRFGFSAEKARRLQSPFPPAHFMALELADGALEGVEGSVRYPLAFGL